MEEIKKIHGNTGRIASNRKYKDQHKHEQWCAYRVHRNQAKFRGEGYELTFEDYCEFWDTNDRWAKKGRKRGQINLKRIIPELPWAKDNIQENQRVNHKQEENNN